MSGQQMYMPTKDYFIPDRAEFKELQKEAADLHAVVDARDTAWIDRTRASSRLPEVERKIGAYLAEQRQERQVQVRHTAAAAPAEQQFALPVPYFESEEEQVQQGPVEHAQLEATLRWVEEARKAAGLSPTKSQGAVCGTANTNADTVWPWRSAEVKAANASSWKRPERSCRGSKRVRPRWARSETSWA